MGLEVLNYDKYLLRRVMGLEFYHCLTCPLLEVLNLNYDELIVFLIDLLVQRVQLMYDELTVLLIDLVAQIVAFNIQRYNSE